MSVQPPEDPTVPEIPIVSHILTPGSSLDPTFLLIVDGAFALLLLILIALLVGTGGNLHFLALSCITIALWASVKWFVYELRQVKEQDSTQGPEDAEEKKNQ